MKIITNLNAMSYYENKFNQNAENISKNENLTKNIVEENINLKSFEVQTKPIKIEDKMIKTLLDIKA